MYFGSPSRLWFGLCLTLILLMGCQGKKGAGSGGGGDDPVNIGGPCLTTAGVPTVSSFGAGSFVAQVTTVSSTSGTVTTPIPATPGKLVEVFGSNFECDLEVQIVVGTSMVTATPISVSGGFLQFAFPALSGLGLDADDTPEERVMNLVIPSTAGTFTVTGAFYLPKVLLVNNQSPLGASNTSTLSIWTTALNTLLGTAGYNVLTAPVSSAVLNESEVVIWFVGGNDGADFFTSISTAPVPSFTSRTAIESFITTAKTPIPGVDISGFCLTTSLVTTAAEGLPLATGATYIAPPAFGIASSFYSTAGVSFFSSLGISELAYNFAYYYGAGLGFGTNAWYVVNTPGSGSILSSLPSTATFTCSTPLWEYFTSSCANDFPMNSLYSHMDGAVDFTGDGEGTGLLPGFSPVWTFVPAYYGETVESTPCSFTQSTGEFGFDGIQANPAAFPDGDPGITAMHAGVTGPTNVVFSGIPFEALLGVTVTTGGTGYPIAGPGNLGTPAIFASFLANLLVYLHDGEVPVAPF
jgi:hypothetical protein